MCFFFFFFVAILWQNPLLQMDGLTLEMKLTQCKVQRHSLTVLLEPDQRFLARNVHSLFFYDSVLQPLQRHQQSAK